MTHEEILAVWASVLSFLGGGLLVIETFSPVRGFLHEEGEKKWKWLVAQLGNASGSGPTPDAPPENDARAFHAARRSQLLTRTGFVMVTLGFLLDLLGKLHVC
jgi:hypothetical protein